MRSTEKLLNFCALPDTNNTRDYVEDRRTLLEKMMDLCDWDAGLCEELPEGVMIDEKMPRTSLQIFSDSI